MKNTKSNNTHTNPTRRISIHNLTVGMTVLFYGHKFVITSDAVELSHRAGVFICDCAIEQTIISADSFDHLLNEYDRFQGSKNVDFAIA